MGMRASAIEKLLTSRKNRPETSFSEMGERPPLAGGEMRALASALSGMSASAGTYGGVTPKNIGFNESLKALDSYDKRQDDELMSNIKVAGLADEEVARKKPIDELTRKLMQQRVAELPVDGTESMEIPPGFTFGDIEGNPVLGQLFEDLIPKRTSTGVKDEILRNQELMKTERMKKPVSEIDRKFLNKKLMDAGIEQTLPPDYTYGDVEDNVFFSQFKGKMKGMTPYQKESLEIRKQQLANKTGLTPYQQESLALRKQQVQAQRERAEKQDERADKKEKQGTPNQHLVAGFARRLNQSESVFTALDEGGFDRSSMKAEFLTKVPDFLTGKVPELGGQVLQQAQAERNFVTALLRRESGAAIAASEFDTAEKQYFPRAGDTPEVLAQKRRNREIVIDSFSQEAGPVLESGGSSGSSNSFPKTIRKDGQSATVNNEQELKESRAEGWQ